MDEWGSFYTSAIFVELSRSHNSNFSQVKTVFVELYWFWTVCLPTFLNIGNRFTWMGLDSISPGRRGCKMVRWVTVCKMTREGRCCCASHTYICIVFYCSQNRERVATEVANIESVPTNTGILSAVGGPSIVWKTTSWFLEACLQIQDVHPKQVLYGSQQGVPSAYWNSLLSTVTIITVTGNQRKCCQGQVGRSYWGH